MELQIITIQKVFAMNKPLHQYLESKELNKMDMPFFIEKGSTNPHNIIMLSPYGRLFCFKCRDGRYESKSFDNEYVLHEALDRMWIAIYTRTYPFFTDTFIQIYRNLNCRAKVQPLF